MKSFTRKVLNDLLCLCPTLNHLAISMDLLQNKATKLRPLFIKDPIKKKKTTLNYRNITKSRKFIVAPSMKFVFRKGDSFTVRNYKSHN